MAAIQAQIDEACIRQELGYVPKRDEARVMQEHGYVPKNEDRLLAHQQYRTRHFVAHINTLRQAELRNQRLRTRRPALPADSELPEIRAALKQLCGGHVSFATPVISSVLPYNATKPSVSSGVR